MQGTLVTDYSLVDEFIDLSRSFIDLNRITSLDAVDQGKLPI